LTQKTFSNIVYSIRPCSIDGNGCTVFPGCVTKATGLQFTNTEIFG